MYSVREKIADYTEKLSALLNKLDNETLELASQTNGI